MPRNCIAEINLLAIKKNCLYAKSLAPKSKIIAVLKANAYGHGAAEVAKYLQKDVDMFALACAEEALQLRKSITNDIPIILLDGIFDIKDYPLLKKYNLIQTICTKYQLQWLLDANIKKQTKIFIKHDSGMNHLGFNEQEFKKAILDLENKKNIDEIILMTHLVKAYKNTDSLNQKQINSFNSITNKFNYPVSIANSAGVMGIKESIKEYNRIGIMLYGQSPINEKKYQKKLTPTITISSTIIAIKNLKKGQGIGYGHNFICQKDMKIGIVAIGYADGYPKNAKNGTPVYINGTITKIIGDISMDVTAIDLTSVKKAQIGNIVEMFGENINIADVAKYSNTSIYEIFSKINNSRVYKVYKK